MSRLTSYHEKGGLCVCGLIKAAKKRQAKKEGKLKIEKKGGTACQVSQADA